MSLADRFDALLIDLDGVVWRGDHAIPGAAETIASLRERGKRVVFVTNNASRSQRDYAMKLMRMLVPTEPGDVITSALAVVQHLRDLGLTRGDRVHVFGTDALAHALRAQGFVPTGEVSDVAALVVAWNPDMTFGDLAKAADTARAGVPFVGANRDATYPVDQGLLPGSGAIVAAVETASGRRATIVGKPEPLLFRLAMRRAGAAAERTLFVGDRADSDVAGARAAGIPVALVLTGVTTERDLASLEARPDWILESLADVLATQASGVSVVPTVGGPADTAGPPSAEREDEQEARDEAAYVSEEGDAATLFDPAEAGEAPEELDDEPEPERDPGWGAHAEEEEPQRHERDDGGAWEQDEVSAEHPGDRP